MKIGIIIGSARKNSFSKAVADGIKTYLPKEWEIEEIKIDHLTMYNQDFDEEGNTPKEWVGFRAKLKEKDAFLFVTPEHNRSIPALLKNALDIGSRPYGENQWGEKPVGIASISIGRTGGYGANHILRQSMVFLNAYTMQQPEFYLGNVMELLNENGQISEEKGGELLQTFANGFTDWVSKFQ